MVCARRSVSGRQIGKDGRRHLHGKFLEQADVSRDEPIAQMHQRHIQCRQVPLGHDFDQPALPDQLGLNHRWQKADTLTREQCGVSPVKSFIDKYATNVTVSLALPLTCTKVKDSLRCARQRGIVCMNRTGGLGRLLVPEVALRFQLSALPSSGLRDPSLYDFRQIRNVQRCDVDAFLRVGGTSR